MKIYISVLLILSCAASINAFAQKLPKVQQESVYAPANIKIDGKATEWDNQYKAYNTDNHIFYTVSNDDKDLYLTVCSSEYENLSKIIYGGITLTIRDANNKKDNASISFPVQDYNKNWGLARSAFEYYHNLKNDLPANKGKTDTLMNSLNTRSSTTFKEIQVSGIKEMDEPLISVYNNQGVKAIIQFDSKIALTYELAIPLKYLGLNSDRIKYNIKLNGRKLPAPNPNAPPAPRPANGATDLSGLYLDTPTDFGGEYTLAKK
jgi:hypothetical protein